jgi:hypothetical protein
MCEYKDIDPDTITCGSDQKVWWLCEKGHEWEASVSSRNTGAGCPYCSHRFVSEENCLSTVNPELSKQWHPTKNGSLTPYDIASRSNKIFWWLCDKGHEWETSVCNRSRGNGCPCCSNKKVCEDNCLSTTNPELAKQWHPTKNGNLTPDDFTRGSGQKVWWICEKRHEWETTIASRSSGCGCPFCSGLYLIDENRLSTTNPELAKQWHPTKNGNLTQNYVGSGSHEKVWWICEKGHEWEASVENRSKGKGCPYCVGRKVCEDNCLSTANPELAKQWNPTKNGSMTPNEFTAGAGKKVWWRCDKGHEWEAAILNRKKSGCPYCSGKMVNVDNCLSSIDPELAKQWHPTKNEDLTPNEVTISSGKKVWWVCEKGHEWEAVVGSRTGMGSGCPYCSNKAVCQDNSLETTNKKLAKQWHPTKNGELTTNNVTRNSNKKVWWICEKGHEWEAVVGSRNGGCNCPFCSGRKATKDKCLSIVDSKLSSEWHPTKNGNLTPDDVSLGSNKKVWWLCKNGHEWEAVVYNRSKDNGCPYCSGKKKS